MTQSKPQFQLRFKLLTSATFIHPFCYRAFCLLSELYIISGEFDEFGQIDGRIFLIVDSTLTDDSGANGTPDDPSDAANPDEPPPEGSTDGSSKASPRSLTSWLYLGVALFVAFIGY